MEIFGNQTQSYLKRKRDRGLNVALDQNKKYFDKMLAKQLSGIEINQSMKSNIFREKAKLFFRNEELYLNRVSIKNFIKV
jgi:hypothetical protein